MRMSRIVDGFFSLQRSNHYYYFFFILTGVTYHACVCVCECVRERAFVFICYNKLIVIIIAGQIAIEFLQQSLALARTRKTQTEKFFTVDVLHRCVCELCASMGAVAGTVICCEKPLMCVCVFVCDKAINIVWGNRKNIYNNL